MSKQKRLNNNKKKNNATIQTLSLSQQPAKDKSPVVHQRNKIDHYLTILHRELTPKQKLFMELAMDRKVKLLLISGPAGSTKTYLSVLASLMLMNEKKVSDILYVRSIVESADVKMGTLPGEADDKLSPFKRPLIDKMDELLPKEDIQYLIKENRVEGLPIGYLRGLNWNAKAIIADEVQNMTQKEIVTLITRVGEFSKIFILGDPDQSDIGGKSGFKKMYDVFDDEESRNNGIFTFTFDDDDIVRSKLVRFIIKKIKKAV